MSQVGYSHLISTDFSLSQRKRPGRIDILTMLDDCTIHCENRKVGDMETTTVIRAENEYDFMKASEYTSWPSSTIYEQRIAEISSGIWYQSRKRSRQWSTRECVGVGVHCTVNEPKRIDGHDNSAERISLYIQFETRVSIHKSLKQQFISFEKMDFVERKTKSIMIPWKHELMYTQKR